ncbi:MAG: PAS domain-containing sensor histidine kinase [Candidatus Melainabacteria bacterium]|nr:PAS domain-containing sensor histidine kinase [Candidatus Melainabacteria bacterium]
MFTIFGAGRWLLSPANRQFRRTGFALIVSVAIAACFSLVGYFYGVPHLYKISSFTEMAMSAATAFALIASSMLTAFTNEGPIAALATNTAGAIVARRLLPVAIFLPPIIGFARLHGEQLGFYSSEFGVAIMVLSMMLAMTTLAYWIAHAVDREDITKKYAAALSASEERYRSITDSVNDAIVSADSNNKITFVNTAFTSIFKYAPSEVIGKPLTLLMPSRFQADHNAGIHRFLTTGESRIIGKTVELAGITKEGKEFPLELSVGTWKDAEQSWFTAIIRDISERKNAEEQAKRLQFLSAREDFLAVLMHNLKNPIIGADRVFDALTSKMKGSLTPDLEKIISELQRSNKNVLDMMNELIEVYQYETDPRSIERKKTDVALLVRNSINDARAMADNHGVDVILIKEDNHEDALLAPVGVGRIIKNLLDNAIKFSDNGGCVRVSVRSIGPSIEISVHNYGKTISPEEKDMLFRGFWRGVAGKTLPPGTGLGLYLCRVIVEAHQGSITCTSNDGEGTTFSVVLPST